MPATIELAPGLALTGHGAAWLPDHGTLVVADVHLGYARAARRRGGWLPTGEDADASARRLVAAARAVGAGHVVVAGDLRHSTRDVDDAELAEVRHFLAAVAAELRVTLLPGNHDRDAARHYAGLAALATEPFAVGPFEVAHEPPAAEPARWTVCGHLHPSTEVRDPTGAGTRYPCALVGPRVVVLPAFSAWAGGVRAGRLRRALFAGDWSRYPVAGGEVFGPMP